MGKQWLTKGLHHVRFVLRALSFATLLCGVAQSASAAPMTMLQVELVRHGDNIEAAMRSVEAQLVSMEQSKLDVEPETKPKSQPTKIVAPAVAQLPTPTGGSMSNTSVTSSGGSSSSIPPADLPIASNLLLAMSGELLADSDYLFIPPRFLDGVFRPPRHVVSL